MSLSPQKIQEYKQVLEAQRKDLLEELDRLEKQEDFGNDVDAFDAETDEAEERGNTIALGQTLRDRINEIDSALRKIEDGAYGKCERCRGEISEAVLAVAPESRLCAECKKSER